MNKGVQQLARHLRRLGYEVTPSGGGHLAIIAEGRRLYSIPSTPSDRRWYRNTISELISLNIIDHDPKKAGQRRALKKTRQHGGQPPPPLPEIGKENSVTAVSVSASGRKFHTFTQKHRESAMAVFDDIATQWDLTIREGRSVAHGATPILARILQDYKKNTGKAIPAFNYKRRDVDDAELARLCAGRVADLVGSTAIGEHMASVSIDSLSYASEAWRWFEKNDYQFSDKTIIHTSQRGIDFETPAAEQEDGMLADGMPDLDVSEVAHTEAAAPPWFYSESTNGDTPMLAFRVLAKLASHGVPEDEAIALAMEVAQK